MLKKVFQSHNSCTYPLQLFPPDIPQQIQVQQADFQAVYVFYQKF